jgi:ribosomal protein S13
MKTQQVSAGALVRTLPSRNGIIPSSNPRAPKADITNSPHLFGDIFDDYGRGDIINDGLASTFKLISGDIDEGDIDDMSQGDIDEVYGDLYGDLYGDPATRRKTVRNVALGVGAGAAGAVLTKKAIDAIKRMRMKRSAQLTRMNQQIAHERGKQTISNQRLMREHSGKINRNAKIPFFQLIGARMNQSPIDPMEGFPADMLKYFLDRQAAETPFQQETAIGVFALGTWTATANGVVANRFFSPLIVQLGINQLNAAPGTVFNITATIPTLAGTLTISSQPFIFTIEKSYDVRFVFFPWQLVQNRPLPVLGVYNTVSPITINVTGLPSASSVNLIVPGSLHPWVIAIRNGIIG